MSTVTPCAVHTFNVIAAGIAVYSNSDPGYRVMCQHCLEVWDVQINYATATRTIRKYGTHIQEAGDTEVLRTSEGQDQSSAGVVE